MRLSRIYVRFYKSFNYDYERKANPDAQHDPWEDLDGAWYPYVRMPLEDSITTVVGANESGKSHLLDAIDKLVSGKGIDRSDFCRYSAFFSVEKGKLRTPDFGGEFEVRSLRDVTVAKDLLDLELGVGTRFHIFRSNGGAPTVYLPGASEPIELDKSKAAALPSVLPTVFRLHANLPLPDSIPLYELTPNARRAWGNRRSRGTVYEKVLGRNWTSQEEFAQQVPGIFSALSADTLGDAEDDLDAQYELGRSLLFTVAEIDREAFRDLDEAIDDMREGYVNGVIQKINDALACHLNFPRWWAQDRDFRLLMSPRETELVFTIRDRTGTDYSFAERSNGLKYFLSYYVQLLAHPRPPEGESEILLMDEPDAFLSSQGQQDLLRVLEDFAEPEARTHEAQVIYVTHSPFLINRNAGDRIRVLDKGVGEEGTRVVKDVVRNHYEPLRSALGSSVAETAFIGGANLFVEGLADQVLLAGVSSYLRSTGTSGIESIDLNDVTIVPAGSAASIPYLIYLARGRDEIKPPCVALLDGDRAGKDAVEAIRRGGARNKQVLPPEYVIQVAEWAAGTTGLEVPELVNVEELEDLIPVEIAIAAARSYATKMVGLTEAEAESLRAGDVTAGLASGDGSLWHAVSSAFSERLPDAHIEKVGFAKEVVGVLSASRGVKPRPVGVRAIEANFRLLLAEIARRLRAARQAEDSRRLGNRLDRVVRAFLTDHPTGTTRDRGRLLLEDVNSALDGNEVGDRVQIEIGRLRRDFKLDENLTDQIEQFPEFRERVDSLRYLERLANQGELNDRVEAAAATAPRPRPKRRARSTVTPRAEGPTA